MPASPQAQATKTAWKIDPSHSTIEFSAKHMMFTTVKGRFADVDGTITTQDDTPGTATVDVTMQAASIDTRTEMRDNHLRSADFLDVEQFPTVTFKSTKIAGSKEKFSVTGDLTIRGVTKRVSIDFEFTGSAVDPFGNTRVGFEGETVINRKDWGVNFNAALEAGGVLVSENITLEFEISAIKSAS